MPKEKAHTKVLIFHQKGILLALIQTSHLMILQIAYASLDFVEYVPKEKKGEFSDQLSLVNFVY